MKGKKLFSIIAGWDTDKTGERRCHLMSLILVQGHIYNNLPVGMANSDFIESLLHFGKAVGKKR